MDVSMNHELVSDGLQRIAEAARFLGVSRSLMYRLINSGTLPTVRIGRSRRIPIRAVREFAAINLVAASSQQK